MSEMNVVSTTDGEKSVRNIFTNSSWDGVSLGKKVPEVFTSMWRNEVDGSNYEEKGSVTIYR